MDREKERDLFCQIEKKNLCSKNPKFKFNFLRLVSNMKLNQIPVFFYIFTDSGCHRVKMLTAWLIDLPTFFYSPTRATRDIVMKDDDLEEVKTVYMAILELDWVLPHSGFGATLNPINVKKIDPSPMLYSRHANFFLLPDLYPPLMNIYGSC